MLESVAKIMWALVIGSFGIGGWVATLEWRTRSQDEMYIRHEHRIEALDQNYTQDQRRLIDILGRMDERLKSIEKQQQRGR